MNHTQVNPKFKDSLFRLVFRGIFYHSRVLRNYVEEMRLDIYSRKQLVLPLPIFVVFYNGNEELHIKNEKNISYEEGLEKGISALIKTSRRLGIEKQALEQTLTDEFTLSEERIRELLSDYPNL